MSKNESWVVGQTLTLKAEFKVDNVLTTPTTYQVEVKRPVSGTTSTPAVTVASTGILTATITADEVGYYKFKWTGTGTAAGVKEGTFYIHGSAL